MAAALQAPAAAWKRLPLGAKVPAALVGLVVLQKVLDGTLRNGAPLGIIAYGVMLGSLNALVALGIVLIYRANKVVNFAQAEFGSVAGVLAVEFRLQLHLPFFVCVGLGLVLAFIVGVIVETVVIRRFRQAPRLILSVVTIGLAQILNGISVLIPLLWSGLSSEKFTTPFSAKFEIAPVKFDGNSVIVVVAVPIVVLALTVFLRYTDYGIAIRAAAENGDRANLLGVPTKRLTTIVWGIAGFMSALAIILRVSLVGFTSFSSVSGGGYSLLLTTLAAAVLGSMESLPVTFGAAVALGVIHELGSWTFHTATYVDALLLVVILAFLLAKRARFSRATETGIGTFRALKDIRPIPPELRGTKEVRLGLLVLRSALVLFALGVPLFTRPSQQQLAALVLIYSIVAVSLVVLTGWSGQISLGHFALVGFGAATTGVLVEVHGWDLFAAVPVAIAVSAAAAFLIGVPALRISGPFLAVTTLAFAVTSSTFFLSHRYVPWFVPDFVPRPALWGRVPIDKDWQMYYLCLVGLVIAMAAARSLRNSRTGRALIATRDNFQAAQSVSINTTLVKLTGFAISGGIAGFAGSLYVLHQTAFKTDAFGPEVSLRLFSMVVIGGLGSLPGAILGAVYIRGAEFFLPPGYSAIFSGVGIILTLQFLPGGLGSAVYGVRDAYLRWVANRHQILVPSLVADVRLASHAAPVALDQALGGLRSAVTEAAQHDDDAPATRTIDVGSYDEEAFMPPTNGRATADGRATATANGKAAVNGNGKAGANGHPANGTGRVGPDGRRRPLTARSADLGDLEPLPSGTTPSGVGQ